jgi:hypothetical protein
MSINYRQPSSMFAPLAPAGASQGARPVAGKNGKPAGIPAKHGAESATRLLAAAAVAVVVIIIIVVATRSPSSSSGSKSPTPPPCKTNSDCTTLSAPVCTDGTCGPCAAQSDCAGTSTPYCVGGSCAASCTTNAAGCVSPDPYCAAGACSSTCTASSQCAAANSALPFCVDGACVASCASDPTGCASDAPFCDIDSSGNGSCSNQCDDNSQCSGLTPYCASGVCSASQCGSLCAKNQVCDPTSTSCVTCYIDASSGASVNCISSSDPVCDTSTGSGTCVKCVASASDTEAGGIDPGCVAATPTCYGSSGPGQSGTSCKFCDPNQSYVPTDSTGLVNFGCTPGAPYCNGGDSCQVCDPKAASGAYFGCGSGWPNGEADSEPLPVCNAAGTACVNCYTDGSTAVGCASGTCDAAANGGTGACYSCYQGTPGAWPASSSYHDPGCAASDAKACNAATNGSCVACYPDTVWATAAAGAYDYGCSASKPACFSATQGSAASCGVCDPDPSFQSPAGTVAPGCSAGDPVCTTAGCVYCDTDTAHAVGGVMIGCTASAPFCGSGSDLATGCSFCSPKADASGNYFGCDPTSDTPVCNAAGTACVACYTDSTTNKPVGCATGLCDDTANDGDGLCLSCYQKTAGVWGGTAGELDPGCTSKSAPACNAADAAAGSCVACYSTIAWKNYSSAIPSGIFDYGCNDSDPICSPDAGPACAACDATAANRITTSGNALGWYAPGCSPDAPTCAGGKCVTCDPNQNDDDGASIYIGCTNSAPFCATTSSGAGVCQVCDPVEYSNPGMNYFGCGTAYSWPNGASGTVCNATGSACVNCYTDTDTNKPVGCSSGVCDGNITGGECTTCYQSYMGLFTSGDLDPGCTSSDHPVCNAAIGGSCVTCYATADWTQTMVQADYGCIATASLADPQKSVCLNSGESNASCAVCDSTRQITTTDNAIGWYAPGCSAASPICDNGACITCDPNPANIVDTNGTHTYNGCSADAPFCAAGKNGANTCQLCDPVATPTDGGGVAEYYFGCGNGLGWPSGNAGPTCTADGQSCVDCYNNSGGNQVGCSGAGDLCDAAANNGLGLCVTCNQTLPWPTTAGWHDPGCTSGSPACTDKNVCAGCYNSIDWATQTAPSTVADYGCQPGSNNVCNYESGMGGVGCASCNSFSPSRITTSDNALGWYAPGCTPGSPTCTAAGCTGCDTNAANSYYGVYAGCTSAEPYCSDASGTPTCQVCDPVQSTASDGSGYYIGCGGVYNTAGPVCNATGTACVNCYLDGSKSVGCVSGSTTSLCNAQMNGGIGACAECYQKIPGVWSDTAADPGCTNAALPACNLSGDCAVCYSSVDWATAAVGAADYGCAQSVPACDAGQCVRCVPGTSPGTSANPDTGCVSAYPTCYTDVDGVITACGTCDTQAPIGSNGCSNSQPCNLTSAGGAAITSCGCSADSDCPANESCSNASCIPISCNNGGACPAGTYCNTANAGSAVCEILAPGTCFYDATTGDSTGCSGATPACLTTGFATGVGKCAACTYNADGAVSAGCAGDTPVCYTTGGFPSGAGHCVTCTYNNQVSSGCSGESPTCMPTNLSYGPGACVGCFTNAAGNGFGCTGSDHVCYTGAGFPAGAGSCVTCTYDADSGVSTGCSSPTAFCYTDPSLGSGSGTCFECAYDADTGVSAGCGGDTPVCYTGGDFASGGGSCVSCTYLKGVSSGCTGSTPTCAPANYSFGPGTCAGCFIDTAGTTGIGCAANQVCNTGIGFPVGTGTCVPCMYDETNKTSYGCGGDTPLCYTVGQVSGAGVCAECTYSNGVSTGCSGAAGSVCAPFNLSDGPGVCAQCFLDKSHTAGIGCGIVGFNQGSGACWPIDLTSQTGPGTCDGCTIWPNGGTNLIFGCPTTGNTYCKPDGDVVEGLGKCTTPPK